MIEENNKTLWCGNLAEQVTEELLYELFLQAGPLEKVTIPRDRDGRQKSFGFITFCQEVSVPYAINLLRGTALFHRTLTLQCRGGMATLPPPIRCTSLDQSFDFQAQTNTKQQFADMTRNMNADDIKYVQAVKQLNDDLVIASLQGNWSAPRHHPYRKEDRRHGRDSYKSREERSDYGNGNNKHPRDYRDRRNNSNNGRYNNRNNHHRRE